MTNAMNKQRDAYGGSLGEGTADPENPARDDVLASIAEAQGIFGGGGRSEILWALSDDEAHDKTKLDGIVAAPGGSRKDPSKYALSALAKEGMIEKSGKGWRLRSDLSGKDAFLRFCAEMRALGEAIE